MLLLIFTIKVILLAVYLFIDIGTGTHAGKFEFPVYGGGTEEQLTTYAKQNWYHVAAVRRGKQTKLYINGTEDSGARYSEH